MTTDPALANLHSRDDRLAEIERAYDEGYAYAEDDFDVDMEWLIEEVKRLRSEVEDWKRGSAEEARAGDDARAEIGRLRAALKAVDDLNESAMTDSVWAERMNSLAPMVHGVLANPQPHDQSQERER